MHKQILMCYMISLLQISTGMTEYPCYFPCPWHNQTFGDYNHNFSETWTFNADGRTSTIRIETRLNFICHQITEKFLILRLEGTDSFRCFSINYNPDIPLEFVMGGWNSFRSVNQTTSFTDVCEFCGVPDYTFLWTVGRTPPSTPLPPSLGCNRPSSCSPPGEVCDSSETIPKACPIPTTSPPTTTNTKTTKSHCGKKHNTRSTTHE